MSATAEAATLLELRGLTVNYGAIQALAMWTYRAGGRGRHADRRERRGQEHDLAGDLAPPQSPRRSDLLRRAGHHARPAGRGRARGHRAVPRRATRPHALQCDGQPRDGRLYAHGSRGGAGRHRAAVRALPDPRRAAQTVRGHPQRRRATDAGDRPRRDEPPAALAAGRTEPRPRAAHRARRSSRSFASCTSRA